MAVKRRAVLVRRVVGATAEAVSTKEDQEDTAEEKQSAADLEEAAEVEEAASGYNWARQWYPVMPLAMLHGKGPVPVKLLGKEMVLWRDGSGDDSWRCSSGICPHRLAPLAKGRVNEDGQLMCRFHGWCFKGNGACAKVPMAEGDPEAESRLLGTDRTRLPSYPTKVRQGLLFVWPDAESQEAAEASEPFVSEELDQPTWGFFDAPAGWRVWMEQSWDPSHAPFLHQFTLPNFAPENAVAMDPFEVEDMGNAGLRAKHGGYMKSNQGLEARRRFGAPCANSTTYTYPDGRTVGFVFYFVPLEAGRVRHITTSYFVPAEKSEDKSKGGLAGNQLQMSRVLLKGRTLQHISDKGKGPVERLVDAACSRWPHLAQVRRGLKNMRLLQGKLGDQDNAILSFQDTVGLPAVRAGALRPLAPSDRYGGPATEYLLETHADALVARFGEWLAARGGGPFGSEESAGRPQPSEEELVDRWAAHTRSHPDTRAALAFVRRAEALVAGRGLPGSLAIAALCLALGASRLAAVPALLAAGSIVAAGRLRRLEHGFVSGAPTAPQLPTPQLWEY